MSRWNHHRKPRILRAAAILAWVLQGIFTPWMQTPVFAANPGTLGVSVTPVSPVPPDPIADLLASPNLSLPGQVSLTWTAPQGNAGGVPIPNVTVASYSVHLATFSVGSLLGDTTAWWNASMAGSTTLQPPGYSPKSPGSLEAYTFTGLTPGATYYFGIKSTNPAGTLSPIDTKANTPGQQSFAVVTRPPPVTATPQAPNGVLSTLLSNGLQVQLTWTPVTLDTSGNAVAIDHYLVSRYTAIASTPVATVTIPAPANTYTESTGGAVYYYRIQAVSAGGAISAPSDYLDSSSDANRYALASDDLTTRVVMPHDATLSLLAANNAYGKDLEIVMVRQPQDEVNVTLRSYKISAQIAATGETLTLFTFPQNNISVHLGYGSVVVPSQGLVTVGSPSQISAAVLAQIISVYWFNGASFVRVGSPILTVDQAISVTVRNLGTYQIRATTIGTAFRLTQGSPYPRVITPNGAENRRVFWFFDNPSGDAVTGTIYDIRGAHVRDLQVNGMSPTANSLVWDGRDDQGAIVPSGVYLYKISTTDGSVTGTVVVAR